MNNALYRLWHYRERVDTAIKTIGMTGCAAFLAGSVLLYHDHATASYMFGVATGCFMGAVAMMVPGALDHDGR